MRRLALLACSTALVGVTSATLAHAGNPGTIVSSNLTINSSVDGGGNGGYLVNGGTLTVNNSSLTNFSTTGGSGSGGGAGLGGAIMVDQGGTVVLNNVTLTNDEAVGGLGGTASSTGGSLDDLFNNGTPGATGANGTTPVIIQAVDPSGQPGSVGLRGGNGTDGPGGTGGTGGAGSAGGQTNPELEELVVVDLAHEVADTGDVVHQYAEIANDEATTTDDTAHETDDSAHVEADEEQAAETAQQEADDTTIDADDAVEATDDTAEAATQVIGAAGAVAAEAEFTDAAAATDSAVDDAATAIEDGTQATEEGLIAAAETDKVAADGEQQATDDAEGGADAVAEEADSTKVAADATKDTADNTELEVDITVLAADTVAFEDDTNSLKEWNEALANGQLGIGGGGANGGTGGTGAANYGGGLGGGGGAGGDGGYNEPDAYGTAAGGAVGGNGGNGGNGGDGGFGGGGGTGGNGGAPGLGAGGIGGYDGTAVVASGQEGAGGLGGAGGFGGGTGNNGSGYNTDAGQGNGGSGYGGAIFVNAGGTLTINGAALFKNNNVIGGDSEDGGIAGQAVGTDLFMYADPAGLEPAAAVTLAPGAGQSIIFDGTIADNSVASIGNAIGNVATGSGAGLTVAGATTGVVYFNNLDTYTGATVLQSGVLQAQDGSNIDANSNITFEGGTLQSYGSFIRYLGTDSNDAQWVNVDGNNGGGFSGLGAGLTVTLNGGQPLSWGEQYFVLGTGATLNFGSSTATANVLFTNDVNLEGAVANIADYANPSDSDYAILSGVYSNGSMVFGNATDTGVIELTGANTYAGGTTVQDGRLALAGGGSLNPNGTILVDAGAALDTSLAGTETVGGLTGSGTIYLGGNALIVNAGSAPVFAGALVDGGLAGGAGGSVEIATGTQVLTGANAYTGPTTVDAGADLSMVDSGSIALSSGVADNGTFDISSSLIGNTIATLSGDGVVTLGGNILNLSNASTSFAGDIENTGALDVLGGAQTLTGANSFTGQAIIASGATLALSGAGSISDASAVDSEGTFDISAAANGGSAITTLLGGGAVALGANTLTLTDASSAFTGAIGGTGDLVVASGTQTLGGANPYTGATTVNSGAALYLTGPGSIASADDVIDNGIFDISTANGGAGITTLDGDGTANLGVNGLTLTDAAGNFAGNIQGAGGLTIGAGTETLSAANSFTGQATVNAKAKLILTGAGSILNASGLDVNGTADISAASDGGSTVQTLLGTGAVTLGGNTLSLASANTSFGGVISGAGDLSVLGGTQTLTGNNTYTGASFIAAGAELALAGAGGIGDSRLVTDNGTVNIAASTAGAGITTLAGNGQLALGAKTLTVTAGSTGFAGAISGTGGVTVSGGAQSLSGANTYTGATDIDARATLALTGNGTIIDSSGVVDDGTFNIAAINNASTTIKTLSGNGAVVLGAKVLDIADESGSFTGTLNGTGMINILAGAFTVPISAGSSFGGTLGVQNSTLTLNQSSDDSLSGPVSLNNGTVQTATPTTITQNLAVNGTSTLNGPAGSGAAPTSGNSTVLTGNISGTGTLDTSGNVIDDGTGGNSGGADVQSGTFEVGDSAHPSTTYVGNVDVSGSASMLRGHGTIDGNVMNSGMVAPGGSIGTLTVMGNYSQPTAGTLMIEVTPSNATPGVTYSQLIVGGTASLTGGALALQVDDPNSHDYMVGEVYRNVLEARSVTGTFASVTGGAVYDGYVNLTPVYTPTAVNLLATATPKAYQSGNAVLESSDAETIAQLNAASTILDSSIAADGSAATKSGAWGVANGGVGGASGGGNVSDYSLETGTGVAVTPNLVLGLAYSRLQTITTLNADRVQTAGDGFYGYGTYHFGQFQLSAVAGGGEANLTDKRQLASAGLSAVGSKGESFANAAIRLREDAKFGNLYLAPYAQISTYSNNRGGFTDGGAGSLDTSYTGYHGAVAALGAGVRAGYNRVISGTVLRPWVEIGETGFAGRKDAADIETIGTISSRQVSPVAPSALTALGVGVSFERGAWSGNLSYQGELASGASLNTFAASVTYRW